MLLLWFTCNRSALSQFNTITNYSVAATNLSPSENSTLLSLEDLERRTNSSENVTPDSIMHVKNRSADLFKTPVDRLTGQYAVVNSERNRVTLRDKSGSIIWSSDDLTALTLETVGGKQIDSMELVNDQLIVHLGKSIYNLDKRTGKIISWGAN